MKIEENKLVVKAQLLGKRFVAGENMAENRLSSQEASHLHISRRHRNRAERIRMFHQATAG